MQIFLLFVTVILSIILYRMLSSQRTTYPFVRTTRVDRTEDDAEYLTTEAEQGLITIDQDVVIVEGQEYSLKAKNQENAEAYLNIDNGKLISIGIRLKVGEKIYFIDPEHSLFANYQRSMTDTHTHQLFSI
ncbi:MAG TPA: hypothetical protein PL009_07320 [Flavipsychrobacter sp.]|nr:hypothetical protein [Flavipsychrobacter sp.]